MKLASLIFSVSQSTWNTHVHGHRQCLAVMRSYMTDVEKAGVAWSHPHTHLSFGVAEDDGLCDGQGVVQVTQGVKLPLLSLHGDEELLDPLQGQLITAEARHQLEKNTVRVLSVNFLVCIDMQLIDCEKEYFSRCSIATCWLFWLVDRWKLSSLEMTGPFNVALQYLENVLFFFLF